MPVICDIDFEVHGKGRNILILHGGNVDRNSMIDAIEPVFRTLGGWARIYPDTPGHGKSPATGVSCNDDVMSRLSEFISSHFEDERFSIVGESRGGYYARVLAHQFSAQLDGLMLIVPAIGQFAPPPDTLPDHKTLSLNPSYAHQSTQRCIVDSIIL